MTTANRITFDSDRTLAVLGVPGRLTHRTIKPGKPAELWFKQRWVSEPRPVKGYSAGAELRVELRFDDEPGNGHNSFAITGTVTTPASRRRNDTEAGGCLHDDITRVFPELAGLVKWHLVSTDGPMHYAANTCYHVQQGRLDAARRCAVWPEATDEQLTAPRAELEASLQARLPALLDQFRADMERAGFYWSPADYREPATQAQE